MDEGNLGFAGIHYCKDHPNRLSGLARAEHVSPGEDQTELRLPSGASVASREGDLSDIRVDQVTVNDDGTVSREEGVRNCAMSSIVNPENAAQAPQGVLHKDASLEMGVEAMGITVRPPAPKTAAEHGVGVQPVRRSSAHLDAETPVNVQGQEAKTAHEEVAPEPEKAPPTDVTPAMPGPEMAQTVAATTGGSGMAALNGLRVASSTSPSAERIKIIMESERMGRHRLRVNKLAISDQLVVLGYVDDDDAVIVEPPISQEPSDCLTVSHEGNTYPCVYYGFTFEMRVDGHEMLLVVLVRVD